MKKCAILITIAIVLSMFASPAHAFGRRGGRCFSGGGCYVSSPCYTPVYETVVVKEIVPVLAYPVLVPAFQFQYVPQAYAATAPVVPVTGYPVASPIIQPTYPTYGQPAYGQPTYPTYGQPSVNYNQQQQQQNFGVSNKDKIRELAKALLEEMSRMSEENNNGGDNGPPAVPNNFSQPSQPSQPSQQQLSQSAISSMGRTCAQCHTGVGSKGNMVLFTQPGLLSQNINWRRVKEEVASGRMPPKDVHFQLSLQERHSLLQWLQSIGVN